MNCEDVEARVDAFVDRELDANTAGSLRHHFASAWTAAGASPSGPR